jgi:hypothetical protein
MMSIPVVRRNPVKRKRVRFKKLTREYGPLILLATFLIILSQQTADAACAGWLCGVKDKLNATEGFKEGKIFWEMLFVGAQAVIALIFGFLSFMVGLKVRKEESWVEFFALLMLFILVIFSTNYGAAQLMGLNNSTGAGTPTAVTTP